MVIGVRAVRPSPVPCGGGMGHGAAGLEIYSKSQFWWQRYGEVTAVAQNRWYVVNRRTQIEHYGTH